MNKVKLKPCPFCGGEAGIAHEARRSIVSTRFHIVEVTGAVVYCVNCNAETFYSSSSLAVQAWNRRTTANPSEINANGFKTDEERRFDKLQAEIQKRLTDDLKRF